MRARLRAVRRTREAETTVNLTVLLSTRSTAPEVAGEASSARMHATASLSAAMCRAPKPCGAKGRGPRLRPDTPQCPSTVPEKARPRMPSQQQQQQQRAPAAKTGGAHIARAAGPRRGARLHQRLYAARAALLDGEKERREASLLWEGITSRRTR